MPAMSEGGRLYVDGEISPRILRMQPDFQAIQSSWSRSWPLDRPPLREVAVEARARTVPEPRRGRVAVFFSGGVDSWATLLTEPEITDLIFVTGLDILPSILPRHVGLPERVEPLLREIADELGKSLHVIETNIREFSDHLLDWHSFNNSVLCAIALYFESLFERVLIPTDTDHAGHVPAGASHMIDSLWSSEAVEIVDHGSRYTRFERTRLIADDPLVQRSLRVCWENRDGAYNCGHCPKCTLTMMALEALDMRERFTTFPPELDLSELEDFTPALEIQQVIWEDGLRGLREFGRDDLANLVQPAVERGARKFADPALIAAQEEAATAQEQAAATRAKLDEILGSTSWRAMAPLRRLGVCLRRLRDKRG
jgi:hypothetical protein